jgi:hypothetical protein
VLWLQATEMFRFGRKTAYVAVTYFDRFLAQRKVDVTLLYFRHCLIRTTISSA